MSHPIEITQPYQMSQPKQMNHLSHLVQVAQKDALTQLIHDHATGSIDLITSNTQPDQMA